MCNLFKGYKIYVIIIIDCHDVKWEVFHLHHRIKDVLKYLKRKYNIKAHCCSVNEIKFQNDQELLIDYIEDINFNAVSMKVVTF